jgi:hypothetical protein
MGIGISKLSLKLALSVCALLILFYNPNALLQAQDTPRLVAARIRGLSTTQFKGTFRSRITFPSESGVSVLRPRICRRGCRPGRGYLLPKAQLRVGRRLLLLLSGARDQGSKLPTVLAMSLPYGQQPERDTALVPIELQRDEALSGTQGLTFATGALDDAQQLFLFANGRPALQHTFSPSALTQVLAFETSTLSDATHKFEVAVVEAGGLLRVSSEISAQIDNRDYLPPSLSIKTNATRSATGTDELIVTQELIVQALAADDRALGGLRFLIDEKIYAEFGPQPPYELRLPLSALVRGSHTLEAEAFDAAGNLTRSVQIQLRWEPPDITAPEIFLVSPSDASLLPGPTLLTASAADDREVREVEFYVDSVLQAVLRSAPYAWRIEPEALGEGLHSWQALARDTAGNETRTPPRSFRVQHPDRTPPSCAIELPRAGSNIEGTLGVRVLASDNVALRDVRIFIDDAAVGMPDESAPFEFAFDSHSFSYGRHVLRAEARDGSGNISTGCSIEITIDNRDPARLAIITGTAASQPIATLTYGIQNVFSSTERSVTLRYTGQRPAQVRGINGLGGSFDYKGGIFPGIGGTCGAEVNTDCSIVLVFKPQEGGGVLESSFGRYRHDRQVLLEYFDGVTPQTTALRLVGYSAVPAPVTVLLQNDFGVQRPGVSVQRSIYLSRSIFSELREVSISSVAAPFTLNGEDCADFETGPLVCRIDISLLPNAAPGEYEQRVIVRYFDGVTRHEKPIVLHLRLEEVRTSENLLLVYNLHSAAAVRLKDQYLKTRDSFRASLALLPITFPARCTGPCDEADNEFASLDEYQQDIEAPIVAWLRAHPERSIRHVVLMHGIPTRLSAGGRSVAFSLADAYRSRGICQRDRYHLSVAEDQPTCDRISNGLKGGSFTPEAYPGTTALFTHLYMGSEAATQAYIAKLIAAYRSSSAMGDVLSGSAAGLSGSTYYLEDAGSVYPSIPEAAPRADSLAALRPAPEVVLRRYGEPYITSARDVRGFFSWGHNGGRGGDYALNGSVIFGGKSSWYTIVTAESFNGQRSVFQGNFVDWFSANAFGGSNYSSTPIGAVAHVEEPYLQGVHSSEFFPCWERGQLFIECAWASMRSPYATVFGDPWVTR